MTQPWQLPDSTSGTYSCTISGNTNLDHLRLQVTNILADLIDSASEIDQDLYTIRSSIDGNNNLELKQLFVEIINRLKHHRDCLKDIGRIVLQKKQTK